MAENNALITIPSLTLEELRCYVCNGYLSCSPVGVLVNGSCICGRCTYDNITVDRVLPFEAILRKMSFPCQFKKNGCAEMVVFDDTAEHESKCTFQCYACPMLSEKCTWKGSASDMSNHFSEQHPSLLKQNAGFKINLENENAQGIFMVVKDSVGFVIKYFYDSNNKHLKYDVRYCTSQPEYDATCKIKVINDSNLECNINLKSNKCLPFGNNNIFLDMEDAVIINLNRLLESLDYPNVVAVELQLMVIHSNTNGIKLGNNHVSNVSFDFPKCGKCFDNLVPPLFSLDENVICYKCGMEDSSATPSNDTELIKRGSEAEFSCCWRNCNFVGKCDIYKPHILSCEFRIYGCAARDCKETFKLTEAVAHYEKHHQGLYLQDKISYEVRSLKIWQPHWQSHHIFAIKNYQILYIIHEVHVAADDVNHQLILHTSAKLAKPVVFEFEHQHCKVKSKMFNLFEKCWSLIGSTELPPCFAPYEQLTVNVTSIPL